VSTRLPPIAVVVVDHTPASSSAHGVSTPAAKPTRSGTLPRRGCDASTINVTAAMPGATRNGENTRANPAISSALSASATY
jgi:hypothetical protein